MKIERLRNKKSKLIFLCGCLMVVVLLITVVIKGSRAKYRNSNIIPLINTKVKNNISDFTVMGIYLNDGGPITGKDGKKYTKQEDTYTMPSSGYVINEANSYCTLFNKDTNTSEEVTKTNNPELSLYTDILGNHSIKGIKKGYKCHLFFDKEVINAPTMPTTIPDLLLNYYTKKLKRTSFNEPFTDTTTKTVFLEKDDYGVTYYFAGNPTDNWVKFANYYWRIVRINGNGTLRLIYQGTAANTTTNTNWKNVPFNKDDRYGYYVGFMFDYGSNNGNGNSSNIKNELETFYTDRLASYDSNIDKNTGFCGDRTIHDGDGWSSAMSGFMGRFRIYFWDSPTFTCPDVINDLFTVGSATNGNKKLTKPIGLITGDEVMMGGLIYRTNPKLRNINMYDTGLEYWTMTPDFNNMEYGGPYVGKVGADGRWIGGKTTDSLGVRPVINLKKDIKFSKGNGSISSPFEI